MTGDGPARLDNCWHRVRFMLMVCGNIQWAIWIPKLTNGKMERNSAHVVLTHHMSLTDCEHPYIPKSSRGSPLASPAMVHIYIQSRFVHVRPALL